jgi:hypothetical protein
MREKSFRLSLLLVCFVVMMYTDISVQYSHVGCAENYMSSLTSVDIGS